MTLPFRRSLLVGLALMAVSTPSLPLARPASTAPRPPMSDLMRKVYQRPAAFEIVAPEAQPSKRGEDAWQVALLTNGGCSRIRTYDPLIKSQLLYQLSYAPVRSAGAAEGRGLWCICRPLSSAGAGLWRTLTTACKGL